MVLIIVAGLLLLLAGALGVAVATALRARRELQDLEVEFAEHRGVPLEHEVDPLPWSSIDLDGLRDVEIEDARHDDPYATLSGPNPRVGWEPAEPNGFEMMRPLDAEANGFETMRPLDPEPAGTNGFETMWAADPEPNGFETMRPLHPEPAADLAPIDLRPVAWRTRGDAPIVVLVVGAGFLGTGMTAGITTMERLQRAWGDINDSFAEAGVITLDPDAETRPRPSYDRGPTRYDFPLIEERDPSAAPTRSSSPIGSHDSPNGNGSGPGRISWRPPSGG